MKMHLKRAVEEFVAQTRPLLHQVSERSVQRMLRDDRLWPVDLWMKAPQEGGPGTLQRWQLYPDPCDPGHPGDPMVREWAVRKMEIHEGGISAVSECPEEIMATCEINDPLMEAAVWIWECNNGRNLPNRQPGMEPSITTDTAGEGTK